MVTRPFRLAWCGTIGSRVFQVTAPVSPSALTRRRSSRGSRSWLACIAWSSALWACASACAGVGGRAVEKTDAGALSISGTALAVAGVERWLAGVSLFDALGPNPPRDEDLDALAGWGVTVVRVWAHWNTPVYDARGALHPQGEARLHQLMARLRARGLVVELVLLRPGQLPGERFALFESADARIRAVRAMARSLRPFRNALFDLYNEHDHPHGPISHRDLRVLRDAVKDVDPDRIVTVSSTEYHFLDPQSVLDDRGRTTLREEASTDSGSVAVDLLAVHPPTPQWAEAMAGRIRTLRGALRELGRDMPIYFSEGPRARPGEPTIAAETYLAAARATRDEGAAGWVFHTAAGYKLGELPFLKALNTDERRALGQLKGFASPR
jgi:hypothetical protein